jgi:hypothetical protein
MADIAGSPPTQKKSPLEEIKDVIDLIPHKGAKTYLLMAVTVGYALFQYSNGEINVDQLLEFLSIGLGLGTLRGGIAKVSQEVLSEKSISKIASAVAKATAVAKKVSQQ